MRRVQADTTRVTFGRNGWKGGLRVTGTFGGDNGRRTAKGEDVTTVQVVDVRLKPPLERTVGFGSGRKVRAVLK